MLRRVVSALSSHGSGAVPAARLFPWLDPAAHTRLFKSAETRKAILGCGVGESILNDISESEQKLSQLTIDLKDKSLADLSDLVQSDMDVEKSNLAENSLKIRQLILVKMDEAGYFDEDKLDARIEVRAGVGGDEALKWANELFAMYADVSGRMGWDFTVAQEGDVMKAVVVAGGGSGGPYGWLRLESGVHRVQRVPFNSDKMQTSAAAVFVVPKIDVPPISIRDSDLKIHISKKSSGAGGQSVNAAYQQVRMTHVPTGYTVVCNESSAQQENREMALEKIRTRVQQMEEEKALLAMAKSRKGQVTTADRSEKVRSYNFQRGEVNDHRLVGGVVRESCEEFMTDCGSLVAIWERLKDARENEFIHQFILQYSHS